MMRTVMQKLGPWGPLFFGIGFLAPLAATLMDRAHVAPPLGLSSIEVGLIIGGALGLAAKLRGRWL
jgi:hypothetical protein